MVAEESHALLNSLPADSSLRSAAETIESAARDAFGVTCRLRAFGQEREIKPQVIQVNEVLSHLAKTWHGTLPGFAVELDPAPRPVHADARELTRCLDVLLRHAHHLMISGGGIRLTASGAELEGLDEWVRIRISYTSSSEDAAQLERVFDPSWDGNWEGLPFAYGITRRMGGLLCARIEADKKVVFELYLPSIEVLATGAPTKCEEHKVLLVIERNSEVRRLLHAYFEQHGYNVLEAGNSEEALLLAGSFEPPIGLVIANPATDDKHRPELAARLVELKPGICVRLIEGYREECRKKDELGGEPFWRHLTTRELLEWANDTLQPPAQFAVAN